MTDLLATAFRAYLRSVCEGPSDVRVALKYFDLSEFQVEQVVLLLERTEVPGEVG